MGWRLMSKQKRNIASSTIVYLKTFHIFIVTDVEILYQKHIENFAINVGIQTLGYENIHQMGTRMALCNKAHYREFQISLNKKRRAIWIK